MSSLKFHGVFAIVGDNWVYIGKTAARRASARPITGIWAARRVQRRTQSRQPASPGSIYCRWAPGRCTRFTG